MKSNEMKRNTQLTSGVISSVGIRGKFSEEAASAGEYSKVVIAG